MKDQILLREEKDGILTLTLNRPAVMNSFNFDLLHALGDQIEAVRFDAGVRVVIITGAGDKAFCSGADLKERITLTPGQVREFIVIIFLI